MFDDYFHRTAVSKVQGGVPGGSRLVKIENKNAIYVQLSLLEQLSFSERFTRSKKVNAVSTLFHVKEKDNQIITDHTKSSICLFNSIASYTEEDSIAADLRSTTPKECCVNETHMQVIFVPEH